MTPKFELINPTQITDNCFKLIDKDWMLITAGTMDSFNTMTASWGALGILWHKQIAICFIRPQRFTYEFTEKNDYFTLSFFEEEYRKILKLCGTKSGRDIDKVKETGLKPVESEKGGIYFEQARLVLECKKLYFDDFKPENFLEPSIQKNYPSNDYHRIYIGEIISCLSNTK